MTKNALLPLTIAAMFALAGCASGGADAGDPSAPADGKTVATASATPGDVAKPAKGAQLDARTLADIAQEIAGDNSDAQIADEDAMRAQLPVAEQGMKSMKIEPAKCASIVSADLKAEFDKMNMVTLALPGDTVVEGVQVAIASYTDPADAAANIAQSRKMLKDCSKFSMTMQGQTVEMKVSQINAKTKAAVTEANRSVVSVPGGEIPTIAVSAQDGRNLISVSVMGGSNEADDVAQAQDLVNAVLAMIEEKTS
ncbi:sensor domain-containing protein [Paeniglutamicibacter sp. NPDC091659]|uniref:sensor domain-containing protein n=1 Tax=Paeniglutamicibacter sp. NPDC091659 TaxID=3364389 RepID=UPI0037FCA3E0